MKEPLILAALFLGGGFGGPWWVCGIVAFVYGFWRGGGSAKPGARKTLFVWVAAAVACAWILPALLQDIPVGGRVSARIAGIIGVRTGGVGYFVGYLVTAGIGTLTAILGLSAGIDLRLAVQPPSSRSPEDKRED